MSETPVPPSNSPGSLTPVSHATNMARNIAVSVISTVLGATLIYFLGFQHKNGSSAEDMLVTKEATTKAWKSYVTVENIYYKQSQSIYKDLQQTRKLDEFRENIIKESEKFQLDLPEVIKDKSVDGSFVSMINRRLENEKTSEIKTKKYLDNIQAILKSDLPDEERKQKLTAEDMAWITGNKGFIERAITDVEDLAKTLSERYGQPFAMTDLLVYVAFKKETTNINNANTNNNTDNPGNPANVVPADPGNGNNTNDNNNNNAGNINVNKAGDQNGNNTLVNEKLLVGQWDTKDAGIDLYKNGIMYWNMDNGENASGTWKFSNNQLYMYPKANNKIPNGTTWIFNLSNVTPNSFTMTLAYKPFNTYYLIRSSGN